MNCENCNQLIDEGAAFCGNCGQQIAPYVPNEQSIGPHIARVLSSQTDSITRNLHTLTEQKIPSYAVALPHEQAGETQAIISILLGALGIVGAFFAALVGLTMGIAGLVFGTLARNSEYKRSSTIGIIASSLAVVVSIGVWSFVIHKQGNVADAEPVKSSNAVAAANVTTPCYFTGFIDTLNVTKTKNDCNMNAFNGPTLEASTKAYKVYATQLATVNNETFNNFAKQAVQKDIDTNMVGFTIDKQQFTNFAGSPAYVVQASDKRGVSVAEAVVMRQTKAGANIFVLVQASTKSQSDLSTLEAQWQWR